MRPIHAVRTARAALTLLALTGAGSVLATSYADQVVNNLQSRYDYWQNRGDGWRKCASDAGCELGVDVYTGR